MSVRPRFSYLDYVKAAFTWRFRVPGLGHLPLNVFGLAGFGILGLGHPAFWLLGMAFEAGYLLFVPGNARFQNTVQGIRLLEESAHWDKKKQRLVSVLDTASRDRYQHLVALSHSIADLTVATGTGADELRIRGLSQLLWTFLQLLVSRQRIKGTLGQVSRNDLDKEITNTEDRMSKEPPGSAVCRSLQGTLDIAQRRLDNLGRAEESLRVVDAELDRIEKQFALLREESSVSSSPEAMTVRLDTIMQSLQDTSRWLSDHTELLGGTEEPALPVTMPTQRE